MMVKGGLIFARLIYTLPRNRMAVERIGINGAPTLRTPERISHRAPANQATLLTCVKLLAEHVVLICFFGEFYLNKKYLQRSAASFPAHCHRN